jgi:hypothetical protein
MRKQMVLVLAAVSFLFPQMAFANSEKRIGGSPPVIAMTYIKVFTPEYVTYDKDYPWLMPLYHCEERFDKQQDYLYGSARQYDPILSTSVLCHPLLEGELVPHYKYANFPGDTEAQNIDGSPLQSWSVRAFCEEFNALGVPHPLVLEAPSQVILHCLDHRALPR